jgi:hypothetical protein
MKRYTALVITGSLTSLIAIIVIMLALVIFVKPTLASGATDNQPTPQATVQPLPPQNPAQSNEVALQAQIAQQQQAIADLDRAAQAQLNQLQAQLTDLHHQINQTASGIQAMQTHATELQQAMQTDNSTYEKELNKLQAAMAQNTQQLKQQIETTYAQLQTAYNEIAAQQAQAQANAAASSGGGGGHNNGSKGDDGGSSDRQEHESEHDD